MFPRPIIAITLVVAFISQGVSGQSTSLTPTLSVTPSSMSTLSTSSQDISTTTSSATAAITEVISSTPSGPSTSASVTATNPTSEATTEAPTTTETPTTTKAPSRKTCGWVGFLWKKRWNSTYKKSKQFISNTTEKLQMFLEHGFFNDSSKYGNVNVSGLKVNEKDGHVNVTFKLCLVVIKDNTGFLEDVIKMWEKFGKESVTEQEFQAGEVKLTGWKAKAKECKKCSDGGGGPITIERECEPKTAEYSCNGVKTMMESLDCVNYCGTPKSGAQKISPFDVVLGILLAFSVNFWK